MAWISVPASNMVAGENSLRLWCADSHPGTITQVRVTASEEAATLKDSFTTAGGLAGNAFIGATKQAYANATLATMGVIADMESDFKLSPSEKATWRQAWTDLKANKTKLRAYAVTLGMPISDMDNAFYNISEGLTAVEVWAAPATTTALPSEDYLTSLSTTYYEAYEALVQACTDRVAYMARLDAEQTASDDATTKTNNAIYQASLDAADRATTAKSEAITVAENFTQGWASEGADVTGLNQAASIINQGTLAILDKIGTEHVVEIDGSKLVAGSIYAGQLAANAVVAINILADEITTKHIKAGTVTAASAILGDACVDTLKIAGQAVTVPSSLSLTDSAPNSQALGGTPCNPITLFNHATGGYPTLISFNCSLGATEDYYNTVLFHLFRDYTYLTQWGFTGSGNQQCVSLAYTDTEASGTHDYSIWVDVISSSAKAYNLHGRNISALTVKR